jgi:pyridoxine kinase
MATILAISSQVARGYVGLSAIVPALQALDHEVIALPTVILSNHPGHGDTAGQRIDPALLRQMLATLDRHGWMARIDAVLSGYLPSPEHVAAVADAVALVRARNPAALYYCDPVLGDDPKGLYIAEAAARSLADSLVPLADVTFPNRFELAWLSGASVADAGGAQVAARRIGRPWTIATSIPEGDAALATLAIGSTRSWASVVSRQARVPNGTGDLFSALFMGYRLAGKPVEAALGGAVAAVDLTIRASAGQEELKLVAMLRAFCDPATVDARALD